MLEEMCRTVFREAAMEVMESRETERLAVPRWKGRPDKTEFAGFLRPEDGWHHYDYGIIKKVMDCSRDNPLRDAFNYFSHGERLRDAYIRQKYGSMEEAMRQTKRFPVLFDTFLRDFAQRRATFMEKTTSEIINAKLNEIKRQGKPPQSHGGVANLLKILTQTMKQQGASIRAIAKVQYAVCMQAGIYIPDEFITDVLVAANIEKEG